MEYSNGNGTYHYGYNNGALHSDNSIEDLYGDFNSHYIRSRTNRVRKAMFPEFSLDEFEDKYANAMPQTSRPTLIEMLAEPSQDLKMAIVDLIHLQDESEAIISALPELIQMLTDKDPAVVAQAAHRVYLLSKEDKCIATLASNAHLVGALVQATSVPHEDSMRDTAAALSHISNQAEGRVHIFRSGGIAELVRMLRCPIDIVVHYAVTTLHNLLLYLESAKQDTIACGGLEALVPLLKSKNQKLQALVADSIYFLLLDRPQCKMTFLSLQGPQLLVNILNSGTHYIKLIYAVVRCIRSISTSPENKASLISIGALESLHRVLVIIPETRRKLAVLNSMRNLSDVATNLDTLTPLVIDLIALIEESDDEEIVSCACGILSNLTCNNIRNKQAVCSNGGIPILTRALSRFAHIEDITEPALCTMRHCTARHSLAQQAQNDVRTSFAHPVILSLLATHRPPIVKAALGLVRNCALSNDNLQSIISEQTSNGENVVTIAMDVLDRSGAILRQDFEALEDGVSLLEMVEGAVSALHQLAKEPAIARMIYNRPSLMNVLIELMSMEQISNNEDELMMREIMGLIYQLSKSPEGAKVVEMYGPTPHIVDALRSHHKSIAAYASIILRNMGVDKPIEYRRRMHTEIDAVSGTPMHHHGYSGDMGWMNDGLEPELFNELYNYPSLGDLKNDHIEGGHGQNSWFDTDL